MDSKCSIFIAASVDGFIARPDGDIDWLTREEYASTDGGDYGYADFIATVDALVMGRNSFEKVLTFEPWPYQGTPVIVLSSRGVQIPAHLEGVVEAESGPPQEIVARLAERGLTRLYIDGGITCQRFLQAGLIDEIIITWIPVLLGEGIPLFGALGKEMPLRGLRATHHDNGFVQVHYFRRGVADQQKGYQRLR